MIIGGEIGNDFSSSLGIKRSHVGGGEIKLDIKGWKIQSISVILLKFSFDA